METFNTQLEETQENPVEEETTETSEDNTKEETSVEEQETSKKPESLSSEQIEELVKKRAAKLQEQQWARMKEAEKGEKSAKEELEKFKKPVVAVDQSDNLGLAKTIAALKDFDAPELDYIALIAKAKSIPLEEAAQTEEAKTLVAARRVKVAKENKAPLPSSTFAAGKTAKEIAKMSDEEHREFAEKYRKKKMGRSE